MSSEGWIKISQCCNGTPAEWKISRISMRVCAGTKPKVKFHTHKYTVSKVLFKARVCSIQWVEVVNIVCVEVGCPGDKTSCIEPVSQGVSGKIHTLLTGAKTSNANDITIA
jgi:hypothetical protein